MSKFIPPTDWIKLSAQANDPAPSNAAFQSRCDSIARRLRSLIAGQNGGQLPPAPEGLVGSSTEPRTVDLSWTEVSGASRYLVYSGLPGDVPALVGSTGSESFRALAQEPGIRAYYVSAENAVGEGPRSSAVLVDVDADDPPVLDPPDEVTGLSVAAISPADEGAVLTWDATTGTTTSVRLERRILPAAVYSTIATGVTATTYTDTDGLIPGDVIEYRAIGVNNAGFESPPSAPVSTEIGSPAGDTEPPPVPVMIAADAEGTATIDPVMTCVCSSVVASDLAGYQFGISDVNDSATAEWSDTFADPLGYISRHNGAALLGGTTYYVWARSVDTSVPPNISDASQTPNSEFVVLTIEVTAPKKPLNLLAESPGLGEVALSWGLSETSGAIEEFEIWSQDSVDELWVQRGTAPFTARTASVTGLEVDRLYRFRMRSVSPTGLQSNWSREVELFAAGQDATGGGVGQGQGPYDGMTAFGDDYYVPETVDYVVDVRSSDAAGCLRNALGILKTRAEYPEGHPLKIELADRGETATQIAILLPDGIETEALNLGRTGFQGNPNVGSSFLRSTSVALHLVGSAVTALRDPLLDAEAVRDRNPGLSFGFVYEPLSAAQEALLLDLAMEQGETQVHLWNWQIRNECAQNAIRLGRDVAAVGNNTALVSGQNEAYLHNCEILNQSFESQNGIMAFNTRLNMDGVYIDLPYAQGHAIVTDATPYGDMAWERTNVHRCGGSVAAMLGTGRIESPFANATPGTLTISDWVSPDTWSSRYAPLQGAMLRGEGLHQDLLIRDCDILAVRDTGAISSVWPPASPLSENIADTGIEGTMPVLSTPHKVTVSPMVKTPAGYYCGAVRVENSRLYSKECRTWLIGIQAAPDIDLVGNVMVTTGGGNIEIGSSGPGTVDGMFDEFDMSGNNVAGDVAAFETAYSIASTQVPDVIAGRNDVNLGSSTEDQAWVNFTGPDWNPPQDPPDTGTVINAWDAIGNTTAQNKELRRPVLMAQRAPRPYTGEMPFVRHWGVGYPDLSNDPDPQFDNLLQWPDGNGTFLSYHATENGGQTGTPPEFGGEGSFKALFDPPYVLHENDGKTLKFKDVVVFRPANDGRDPLHFSSGQSWSAPNPDGASIHTEHRRPLGGRVVLENVFCDLENVDEAGDQPKWFTRGYNLPDFEVNDCDFMRDANEHAIYINPYEDVIVRRSTFFEIASQGIQLTCRASGEGGETEINNGPIERSTYTLLDDCHFIDCTTAHAGGGGTRPSYTATLSNRGTCAYPAKIEVKNCSFVVDVDNAGVGQPGYGSGVKEGAHSMGQLVTGFEKGMSTFTRPEDSTRPNGVAQVHSEIILRNNLFHRMNPGRNAVSLRSAECITIENCVWISDYNGDGSVAGSGTVYYRPLTLDVNTTLIRERPALRCRYLLVRNNWAPPETVGSPIAYHGEDRPYDVPASLGTPYFDLHCPNEEIVYDLWTTNDIGFGPGVLYRGDIRPGFSLTPTT